MRHLNKCAVVFKLLLVPLKSIIQCLTQLIEYKVVHSKILDILLHHNCFRRSHRSPFTRAQNHTFAFKYQAQFSFSYIGTIFYYLSCLLRRIRCFFTTEYHESRVNTIVCNKELRIICILTWPA